MVLIEGSISALAVESDSRPGGLGLEVSHLESGEAIRRDIELVQQEWRSVTVTERAQVFTRVRRILADETDRLVSVVPSTLSRTAADTIVAEILPLLAAIEYLENNASSILKTCKLRHGCRPLWLRGVWSEIQRVPFGIVLVIAPYNYPLLLPGVQVAQALMAGNAVVWKPAIGGAVIAKIFASAMKRAGLPDGLLQITEETAEAAIAAIDAGVDKVFFTGSASVGRSVLRRLSESLTPSVMELSGCDAVVLLPGADLERAAKALSFGLRLNGSATCMAPRRVLVADSEKRALKVVSLLQDLAAEIPTVVLSHSTRLRLIGLLEDASSKGATVCGDATALELRPILVLNGTPEMKLASADIFAPVLLILRVEGDQILKVLDGASLALTVSIFGPPQEARKLADHVTAGTVLINDLIVPTADPRVPFGGRRQSGFGVTRGREGLLEMTAVKVVSERRGMGTRHYQPTREEHRALFHAVVQASHADSWPKRWRGFKRAIRVAIQIDTK